MQRWQCSIENGSLEASDFYPEYMVVYICLKMFNSDSSLTLSCNRNARASFVEKPQLKIVSFQKYQH